jgi:Uma2 family endonuclease
MAVHVDESVGLYRVTQERFLALVDCGVLEDEPVELVDGALVEKVTELDRHAAGVVRLQRWLAPLWATERWDVRSSSTNVLPGSDSVVDPDIAVTRRDVPDGRAHGADFAAEVSVSTRRFDLGRKALVYAMAGLPELWVVDLGPSPRVVVHRDASPGGWRTVTVHTDGTLAPLALPVAPLDVAALLAGLPER